MIEPPEGCSRQQQILRTSRSNGFQVVDYLVAIFRTIAVILSAVRNIKLALRAVSGTPRDSSSAKSVRSRDRVRESHQIYLAGSGWLNRNTRRRISDASYCNRSELF